MTALDPSEYPDSCDWRWVCGGGRYSVRIETLALELAGAEFEARCPACGIGSASTDRGIARMNRRIEVARENALIMMGNLDAPL